MTPTPSDSERHAEAERAWEAWLAEQEYESPADGGPYAVQVRGYRRAFLAGYEAALTDQRRETSREKGRSPPDER